MLILQILLSSRLQLLRRPTPLIHPEHLLVNLEEILTPFELRHYVVGLFGVAQEQQAAGEGLRAAQLEGLAVVYGVGCNHVWEQSE